MVDKILGALSAFIVATIASLGYSGVVLMMAIESACIPLPSEVIMPFAGYLVSTGRFNLQLVAIAGAVGCLLGSYVAYYIGASGGRWFLLRYGRWVLIAPHEIEIADRFFDRWGAPAVFFSRMLPVVRTFIAFPGRRRADAPVAVHHLHAGGFVSMVPGAGVPGDEAGTELGRRWPLLPSLRRRDCVFNRRGRRRWSSTIESAAS